MLTDKFLSDTPDLYLERVTNASLMDELKHRAESHTSRKVVPSLFEERSPNETDAQLKYRLKNYRRLTNELYDQFLSKSTRSIRGGGFRLTTASTRLVKKLEERNIFYSGNQYVDWKEFFSTFILPKSLVNPNQLFFLFPYDNVQPAEAPFLVTPQNKEISLAPLLVSYESIRYISNNLFIYETSTMIEVASGVYRPVLFAIDGSRWYKLTPYLREENNGIKNTYYSQEIWYEHNFGFVPFNWLVGRLKTDEGGNEFIESFLATAFEHLDEAVVAISDDQAVRKIAAYPHIIMGELDCDSCAGIGEVRGEQCSACKGTGHRQKAGILDAFVVPSSSINSSEKHLDPFIQFVSPDVGIVEHLHNIAFGTFYRNAFRVVGLKPFTDVQESGEAKKQRQNDLQDVLRELTMACKEFCENMLYSLELYITRGRGSSDSTRPVIRVPKSFLVTDEDILTTRLKEQSGYSKQRTQTQIYFLSNGENPVTESIMKYAHLYSPMLSDTDEQIKFKVEAGIYSGQDVIKRDYAIQVFEELSKEPNFLNWTFPEIKIAADKLLADWGVLVRELDLE